MLTTFEWKPTSRGMTRWAECTCVGRDDRLQNRPVPSTACRLCSTAAPSPQPVTPGAAHAHGGALAAR